MLNILKTRLIKGVVTLRHSKLSPQGEAKNLNKDEILRSAKGLPQNDENVVLQQSQYESCGKELKDLIIRKFGRSLHIREVDAGSCAACESEIIACNNPIYDIQRFGINFVASPRHADCLLVTGPVSKNMLTALKSTYEAASEPKFVITLGDCALDGGQFKGSYYIAGGVKNILPVALHIPGCPPNPETIIKSLLNFLK